MKDKVKSSCHAVSRLTQESGAGR